LILYYDKDGKGIDHHEWSMHFHDLSYKHVRVTAIDDDVEISTVWVGIDQGFGMGGPPLIFETMIFGGDLDGYQWRWPTLEAAEAGHDQAIALVQEHMEVDNG
jgi:hypothetical protein